MPKQKLFDKTLQFRVSNKMLDTLFSFLKEEEMSLSDYLRTLIKKDLKEQGVL